MTKTLKLMPMNLIERTMNYFCDELWDLAECKDRNLANRITCFQEDMRDTFIKELFAYSIVELKTEEQ